MIDFPPLHHIVQNKAPTEFVAVAPSGAPRKANQQPGSTNQTRKRLRDVPAQDPLYLQAQAIINSMKDGFDWADLTQLVKECFTFVQRNQGLSVQQQKTQVVTLMSYIIDITDVPYLPDAFVDPVLKGLIVPIVDLVSKTLGNGFNIIPTLSRATATTFKAYIEKIKETFADGFQWSDMAVCIGSTVEFIGGFPLMSPQERRQAVVDICNEIIDECDMPYIPDALVDPILKAMVPSLVDFIFNKISL